MGLSLDWAREIATCDPAYYRHQQRMFLDFLAGGLVERKQSKVNWDPVDNTVLANEQVIEGRGWRSGAPVEQRELTQWFFKITAFSEDLLAAIDTLERWPEKVRIMQKNWIGRSEGLLVRFALDPKTTPGGESELEVFTTRPDTLFGATFMVLAPEHPMVDLLATGAWPDGVSPSWTGGAATPRDAVLAYRRSTELRTELERQTEGRDKTGVFTGAYATNPVTGTAIPVFVADYVLMGYGTGAIMAVPGQDERDWEFAERFGLPIVRTVQPPEGWEGEAYVGEGPAINSANDSISLDGLDVATAKARITDWLEERSAGTRTVTYKLRDWLFSRQRYWGEPFPVVYDEHGMPRALPESMLPVVLPEVDDYSPQTFAEDDTTSEPVPPLGRNVDWVEVELDLGDGPKRYRRETNTMPQWAGSCWYELRYLDPTNDERFVDPEVERYWMGPQGEGHTGGVDLYIGGVEHAVLHLLYARFWHKVLHDLGHLSSSEPFHRLFNQGYIEAYAYTDERGSYVPAEEVADDGHGGFTRDGRPVNRVYGKMGKSLKNMVTPDEMFDAFGADTFRLYEMSMGPLDQSRPWETRAVVGSHRFLQRLWRNVVDDPTGATRVVDDPPDDETRRLLHRAIDRGRHDMQNLEYITAIARLIELNNHVVKLGTSHREVAEAMVLMVAPLAPHLAEELWSRLGHERSLTYEPFPVADPAMLQVASVTAVLQVAGKVRDRIEVPPDVSDDELRERALASAAVQRALDGRGVRTVVVRAPRLANVVPA
jgi:leucyl-tRNA synthetase